MKKLLVVLLSLGLIVAFSMKATAADVKFSGQYYVNGVYEDNRFLSDPAVSRAFFWTRTRVQTVFNVAEGLSFTTRFDAFEKQWGSVNRSSATTEDKSNSGKISNTNVTLQENLEMEYAYVTFKTAIGMFDVGYQAANEWGTIFGDVPGTRPSAKYTGAFGPFNLILKLEKGYEADTTMYTSTPSKIADGDTDYYYLGGIFNFKGGSAGLMSVYMNSAVYKPTLNFVSQVYTLLPYMKGQFGPVYVEAELIYQFGKARKFDNAALGTDVDKEGLGGYVMAKVNLGPAYVGGQFGYSSGNDNVSQTSTVDSSGKDKSGPISTTSWRPALIFGEHNLTAYNYGSHIGAGTAGGGASGYSSNKQNLLLYNMFGGFNITPALNIEGAFSFMQADRTPTGYISKDYGYEADIKATYKIYDNLTYMVGAGYLWTGDYFRGTKASNKIGNEYLIINQLTLNF
jgi:hypothetical protein